MNADNFHIVKKLYHEEGYVIEELERDHKSHWQFEFTTNEEIFLLHSVGKV